jgi:hypothetical protein
MRSPRSSSSGLRIPWANRTAVRTRAVSEATSWRGSGAAISESTRAPGARRDPRSVPGWQGGGEEIDEQLVDALSLVVMHPVRGVGQALDAV